MDRARCFDAGGCGICMTSCAEGAIRLEGRAARIDKNLCLDCGKYIAACPAGAITQPVHGRAALDAGLITLLADAPAERHVVMFACPEAITTVTPSARASLPRAMLPLPVPATGFVDWYAVLRTLDLGAEGLAILGCAGGGHGCDLAAARALQVDVAPVLEALGLEPERVAVVAATSVAQTAAALSAFAERVCALPRSPLAVCDGATSDAAAHGYAVAALAADICGRLGLRDVVVEGAGLPFGQVAVDAASCSLCGLCTTNCPAGALRYEEGAQGARLLADAQKCIACGVCATSCPEQAITTRRRFEPATFGDALVLASSAVARCEACGGMIGPQALLDRVYRKAGSRGAAISRCPDCRFVIPSRNRRADGLDGVAVAREPELTTQA